MLRGKQDATIHKDDEAASVPPTTTIATTTTTAAARTSTPPLTPSSKDTDRDGRSQPHETKNQELRQNAADQNTDDNSNKEVQVLDGDQVLLTSADNWLMETNGTLNDGLKKLNARRLRMTKRDIAKGKEEGISSLALWDAPDINILRRWAD